MDKKKKKISKQKYSKLQNATIKMSVNCKKANIYLKKW